MKLINKIDTGLDFHSPCSKIQVTSSWTKYLLTTHPVEFITTIGKIGGELKTDIAPFATCLDTSYEPPYVQISCATKQHVAHGEKPTNAKMNTYLNIKQNGLFIVNVPPRELLYGNCEGKWASGLLDIVAQPYPRNKLKDKIALANLTKLKPFIFPQQHEVYPPLIEECLAHLECETIDIHRPRGSDHYNITGKVVGASYDESLGKDIDAIRKSLVMRIWHHFGSGTDNPNKRLIAYTRPLEIDTELTFHLEKNNKSS